ncbi:toll/interleukin-1 receptor domain-containing protein [Frankia canadensis]|uniref:toll/interleukin-1 receptor domain-containing protein n=1 Tax=Frankia canadensis TaxID=1836972 RepID=UPI001403AA00|nr:toll/interleukin-1 receptor domain-containing protein [Frankia canadensis]
MLSCVAADEAWATWLAWHLDDVGYRLAVDVWGGPADSVDRFRRVLVRAEHLVIVLSREYVSAAAGQREWQSVVAEELRGGALAALTEPCERPGALRAAPCVDVADLLVDDARRQLLDAVAAMRAGQRPSAPPVPPVPPDRPAPPDGHGADRRRGADEDDDRRDGRGGVHVHVGRNLSGQVVIGSGNSVTRTGDP